MDSPEPKFVPVARLADLPLGSGRAFEVGRKLVAVFHTAEGLFALDDHCPHSGGPLSEGDLRSDVVTCRWHGAGFRLSTGRSAGAMRCKPATCFSVRVHDGWIEVEER